MPRRGVRVTAGQCPFKVTRRESPALSGPSRPPQHHTPLGQQAFRLASRASPTPCSFPSDRPLSPPRTRKSAQWELVCLSRAWYLPYLPRQGALGRNRAAGVLGKPKPECRLHLAKALAPSRCPQESCPSAWLLVLQEVLTCPGCAGGWVVEADAGLLQGGRHLQKRCPGVSALGLSVWAGLCGEGRSGCRAGATVRTTSPGN